MRALGLIRIAPGASWPMLVAAFGAAVAVGGTLRGLVLFDRIRASTVVRSRLRPGSLPSIGRRGARVLATLDARLRPLLDLTTGAADRARDRRVLTLLESITRGLRAGASVRSAVESASDAAPDPTDRAIAVALRSGRSMVDAVDEWMIDGSSAQVLVGSALRLAATTGGAVAPVLDGVADSLRDRLLLDREVAALCSQARASAAVLIMAPIGFAVLMATIDTRIARTQFASPLGWICTLAGLALDIVGAIWMTRMIARVR
ncbi:MAG: type II secretion system F family protein [Acidobacteria bacterium]|nr:type II secretion system F family protein [Acidobacteriota bacterium]